LSTKGQRKKSITRRVAMSKKIMVVDDEPDMLEMVSFRLKKGGYDVITAINGDECIKKAKEEYPDLIMLDVLLPGISGFEVAKRLKIDEETKDIPIMMVTALIGEDVENKGKERGADYFISKPFDPEDLLAQIKTILKNGNKKG
jgi:DNA-binding response OmpR family regulator